MATDYDEAAHRHWQDGMLLRENKCLPNADQLFGLAAECCLKAIMIVQGAPTTPAGDLKDKHHHKHVNVIWDEFQSFMSGRRGSRAFGKLSAYANNPFDNWSASQRYFCSQTVPGGATVEAHYKAARTCMTALERENT